MNKQILWILIVIMVFGFLFKIQNLNEPFEGLHNWKSDHYLSEARNFISLGVMSPYGLFIPANNFPHLCSISTDKYCDQQGYHADVFPALQLLTAGFWKIFGISDISARLISILFIILSIPLVYSIIRRLFHNPSMGVIGALIFATNPMLNYFSTTFHIINVALFFSLLGVYYYLKWLETKKDLHLILGLAFLAFGIINQYAFALFALPIIFTFQYKEHFKVLLKSLPLVILCLLWPLFMKIQHNVIGSPEADVQYNFTTVFTSQFWLTMVSFFKDNYSIPVLVIACLGLLWLLLKKTESTEHTYIKIYIIGAVVWFWVMAWKMMGHHYHQYPLILLYCIGLSYLIYEIGKYLAKYHNLLKYVFIAIMVFLIIALGIPGNQRMFKTEFIGLEEAGTYIKDHSLPSERVYFSSGQSYTLLWYADRIGYKFPLNVTDFEWGIQNRDIQWVHLYQWGLQKAFSSPELTSYLQNNFHVEQAMFLNQQTPIYLLLKKGGNWSFDNIPKERVIMYVE